jgi:HAMP domain-containing protein
MSGRLTAKQFENRFYDKCSTTTDAKHRETRMTAWYHSIQTKMTIGFVILILVISGMTFGYTYTETKNALRESTRGELATITSVMASQVDTEKLLSLKPGDEATPTFLALRDQLVSMRSGNPDLKNAYIMLEHQDGTVSFLVDDIWGTDQDAAKIGQDYPDAEFATIHIAMMTPTASKEFYTDSWGTFLSGYAPVRDPSGKTVAVIGVDMDSSDVIAKQDFIGSTIYVILGLGALIAALIMVYFSRTIIRDIRKLNDVANRISTGDTSVVVEVHRKDEIGELADSFSRMVASLKIMMTEDNA